ncbi:MAG: DNA alkylation repair protein [Prolixibacteraceae bacterium]|nr:DNA alkylation repair protein [Prolixibacteraceae bacterium]
MELAEVMKFLEAHGSEQTKKVLKRHGAKEPFFGVKISDLKVLQKKIKKDHELALKLYQTGNGDAMYLAALIADPSRFTPDILNEWVEQATWYMVSDYAVAWMAAESPFGLSLAREWIRSNKEFIASAGWFSYASVLAIRPNETLNLDEIRAMLEYITDNINDAPNRVRYAMNNFVIAAGSFVPALTDECKVYGDLLGNVEVDMGETSCKVPHARQYIEKVEAKGLIGRKKKRALC